MNHAALAIHDLGGAGPTVLYAHATGFHSRCWQPVAAALPQFRNIAYDARGHGDTPAPPNWRVDWETYGADASAVAAELAGDGPIVGVGHSMGGAALLMAAIAQPRLFRALVVYEPIVMPSEQPPADDSPDGGNFLTIGARRRRSSFDSFEAAIANFSAKPPLNIFTPEAIDAYVGGGFALGNDGLVHLKCRPEHEARTYETGGLHRTWDHLGEIEIPVWVVCGQPEPLQPSRFMEELSQQLPHGHYIQKDHLGHFGPLQAPTELALLIASVVG